MRRIAGNVSVQEAIDAAVAPVVQQIVSAVQQHIEDAIAETAREEARARRGTAAGKRVAGRSRSQRLEITRWVADRRARRVPTFVIQATGLDTKKKIVAKFGENAAFRKGKSLPAVRRGSVATPETKAARVVRAKPPVIRKAGTK